MPAPSPGRLVAAALRCYPARWRSRHGGEAAEVATLLLRDGVPAASIAWSYARGAARERLTPRPGRRLGTAVATLVVAAGSAGIPLAILSAPVPAGAASVVRVRITDRADAAAQLRSLLRARHVGIAVTREPVSPSLVGSIVGSRVTGRLAGQHDIVSYLTGPCRGGARGCAVGIVLPARFAGSAHLVVGQAAKAGEAYAAAADIFRPGELLACSGLLGETVRTALPVLASLHVRITWDTRGTWGGAGIRGAGAGAGGAGSGPVPDGRYYVAGGRALSSTAISLQVTAERPATYDPATYDPAGWHDRRC
jgi:hypothetical protein